MALPKLRRPRRCSFCRQPETRVAKLLAGASGFICDACVGACNRILEATQSDSRGPQAASDEQLLASLKTGCAAVDACREVVQTQVNALRERGISWARIGDELGISRQAAWERFS